MKRKNAQKCWECQKVAVLPKQIYCETCRALLMAELRQRYEEDPDWFIKRWRAGFERLQWT
jgi:hypothetical protein